MLLVPNNRVARLVNWVALCTLPLLPTVPLPVNVKVWLPTPVAVNKLLLKAVVASYTRVPLIVSVAGVMLTELFVALIGL